MTTPTLLIKQIKKQGLEVWLVQISRDGLPLFSATRWSEQGARQAATQAIKSLAR